MGKREVYASALWRKLRLQALDRDGWQCKVNGPHCTGQEVGSLRTQTAHADHIIPIEEDPNGVHWYELSNLRAACVPCNVGRANRRNAALAKLVIRQGSASPSREW